MDVTKVIEKLKEKYPNKTIIKNDELHPTEILCEINPPSEHPNYSIAISVIDKSKSHKHEITTETYKVMKGKLILHIGKKMITLNSGDKYVITPGNVHWAEGLETWVECRATPAWTAKDHILTFK